MGLRAGLTESGFAEDNCVFRTYESNVTGPGLWVFSQYEPNRLVQLVRFTPRMVIEVKISLAESAEGTTTLVWTLIFTAITQEGNDLIDQIPEGTGKLQQTVEVLVYYLETGEMR
jgi:hypothetical protein